MRVLILHNQYQQRGGEDLVVSSEAQLLREAGFDVKLNIVNNSAIHSAHQKFQTAATAPFNFIQAERVRKVVKEWGADVVHIHNFHPLLSPSVHVGASRAGAAVIQTLHNFRTVCAGSLLLREGHICEKCIPRSSLWGIYHRCYKSSLPGSISTVLMQHVARRQWLKNQHVDRLITLTEFNRNKFAEAGFPLEKMVVKPNFLPDFAEQTRNRREKRGFLFVGRLSPEKGVGDILSAWSKLEDLELDIVGDGPQRRELEELRLPNIRFLGHRSPEDVRELMETREALLLPSIWYEGLPMTLVESFRAGLPILCSKIGSLAGLVTPGVNGFHFEPGNPNDIAAVVRRALSVPGLFAQLAKGARRSYEMTYTPQRNLELLTDVYRQALQARSNGNPLAN